MAEVTGRIESIEEKTAQNGGSYLVVDLEGHDQGFFDWGNHVGAAGAEVGDAVRIEHGGGRYPRISSLEKVDGGDVGAVAVGSGVNGRERRIVRQSVLKAAVDLLSQSDLDHAERELRVVELAGRMEEWVLR